MAQVLNSSQERIIERRAKSRKITDKELAECQKSQGSKGNKISSFLERNPSIKPDECFRVNKKPERRRVLVDFATRAGQAPLVSSFSFNSFQDIPAANKKIKSSFARSKSTFSASSCTANQALLRQLIRQEQQHRRRRRRRQQQPQPQVSVVCVDAEEATEKTFKKGKATEKRSKRESIDSENTVHSLDHHQQQQKQQANLNKFSLSFVEEASSLERKINKVDKLNQIDKLKSFNSSLLKNIQTNKMSQTMQSIQSLSLQLNRAASQCDLNSLVVSSFCPNGTGSGDALDDVTGQASSVATSAAQQQQQQQQQVSTASRLSRLVNKKASRVKEILLQNLGKADKTTDELFKMYEENFYKQQAQALKLQKEFKIYVGSLKLSQEAGKGLNNCILESTGDYQSARHDLVCENLTQMEHLNEDLMEKLRSQVMSSISEYLSHFNELKEKILKRKRKLIDYDSSRRIYELNLANINRKRELQLQQQRKLTCSSNSNNDFNQTTNSNKLRSFKSALTLSNSNSNVSSSSSSTNVSSSPNSSPTNVDSIQSATRQLVDEARLLKLREQYNYCKIMYETINSELYEQLPLVYEKKMKHLLMSLQNYFSIEAQYHSNAGKLYATVSDVIDELPMFSFGNSANNLSDDHHHLHHNNHHDHHHHHHHRHNHNQIIGATRNDLAEDSFVTGNEIKAASSGVGSSRGDSSLESSSSPDTSSCNDDDSSPVVNSGKELEEEEEEDCCVEQSEDSDFPSSGESVALDSQIETKRQEVEIEVEEETEDVEEDKEATSCEIVVHEDDLIKAETDGQVVVVNVFDEEGEQVEEGEKFEEGKDVSRRNCSDKIDLEEAEKDSKVESLEESQIKGEETKEKESKVCCLYKVKTSYKYLAEDVDELCFEADEIIQVVPFELNQEQEEGWLVGIREVNGQKGLFPANFTQPI